MHVGQRVEEALLRLSSRERRVVGMGRLFIKEDGNDFRARRVLKVRDHAAEDRGKTGIGFDRRADHFGVAIITRIQPPRSVPWPWRRYPARRRLAGDAW